MTQTSLNIFNYTDWQPFLREWIELRRSLDPSVTLQSVAYRLGLKARSHLHRLLNTPGKTLAPHLVEPLAKLMKLSSSEADYWDAMVSMSRSRTLDERNRQYLRIYKLQSTKKSADLAPSLSEYFSTWYLPVLREAVMLSGWNGDTTKLARWFDPPIKDTQVRRGIDLLVRLGLLEKSADGKFIQVDALLHTKSHSRELAVTNFQREMIQLGERALANVDSTSREVSTVTFSIPQNAFVRMQQIMREFQETLARESMSVQGIHDSVFQLNLQCFPVARNTKREKL